MQRIYCPDLNISEKTLTLKDEKIVHQLVKVLRSKK
jgi:16S rRNA U1498 N3-methylase RsmE